MDERGEREAVASDLLARRNRRAGRAEALATERVQTMHDRCDEVVQRQPRAPDVEVDVRLDPGEIEDRRDEIAVLARRHDDGGEPVAAPKRVDDREHLDRLRARPHQDQDVARASVRLGHRSSLVAVRLTRFRLGSRVGGPAALSDREEHDGDN